LIFSILEKAEVIDKTKERNGADFLPASDKNRLSGSFFRPSGIREKTSHFPDRIVSQRVENNVNAQRQSQSSPPYGVSIAPKDDSPNATEALLCA
jgi:hypothetical protein